MSAAVIKLPNLTNDEAAVLREIVQLRSKVARLESELALERALRRGGAVELASLRMLRADVLTAASDAGFSPCAQ